MLTPGNSKTEMHDKYRLYQENKVMEYWIVQPEHENTLQFSLSLNNYELIKMYSGNEVIAPVFFPELKILLTDIFWVSKG
jgi:Uma2 family endonuclease